MARPKRNDLVRVNVNLPEHFVQKIDEWAKARGLSRTTAILILCADSLAQYEEK